MEKSKVQRLLRVLAVTFCIGLMMCSLSLAEDLDIITEDSIGVYAGQQYKLVAADTDAIPKLDVFAWESSDAKVATVSKNGTIAGKAQGTATITCKDKETGAVHDTIAVEVWKDVSKVTLSEQKITLLLSDELEQREQTLSVTVAPETAHYETIVWETSNENIATVDENGKIMGIAAGTCKITASVQGKQVKKASCSVTVWQAVKSLTFDSNNHELAKGSSRKLEIMIEPEDASNKKLLWESSDTTIATVSANGTVSGKKCGDCTITATAADGSGVQAVFDVTVVQAVTKITADSSTLHLTEGQIFFLDYTVLPEDATNKTIGVNSQNARVASVAKNETHKGKVIVTANLKGEAEITISSSDNKKAYKKVKVYVESKTAIEPTRYGNWGTYASGVPWISSEFKNTSYSRTIDGITVRYYAENVYGEKIKSSGGKDYSEEIINITIAPGSKKYFPKIIAYQYIGAKRIYVGVSKVHFTNGSSYTVPVDYTYFEY